jgi:hypothetical protein
MHTLQGPLQHKLANKRYEVQKEEIQDRLSHIMKIPNKSIN